MTDLGYVHYRGSRDELNAKLRERDDAIERLTKERDEAIEALRNCADSMGNVAANFLESKDPTFDAADFKGSLSRARSILSKHEVKP